MHPPWTPPGALVRSSREVLCSGMSWPTHFSTWKPKWSSTCSITLKTIQIYQSLHQQPSWRADLTHPRQELTQTSMIPSDLQGSHVDKMYLTALRERHNLPKRQQTTRYKLACSDHANRQEDSWQVAPNLPGVWELHTCIAVEDHQDLYSCSVRPVTSDGSAAKASRSNSNFQTQAKGSISRTLQRMKRKTNFRLGISKRKWTFSHYWLCWIISVSLVPYVVAYKVAWGSVLETA